MPIEIIHHEESPGKRWLRLRQEYRQANLERIRAQFIDVTKRVTFPVKFADGSEGLKAIQYTSNVLPEIHRMEESTAPMVLEDGSVHEIKQEFKLAGNPNDKELAQLERNAKAAAEHIYAEIPNGMGLAVEDVDGPAINDLEDESQIFAAIDKMIEKANENEG